MATKTKKKATKRRVKRVKTKSCRTAGHQMSTAKSKSLRKAGARKLGSTTCKTKSDIKKSTTAIAKISKLAKKIRKKNETWQKAMKRAAKQLKK